MILTELFDGGAAGKVDLQDSDHYSVTARIGERDINFQARKDGKSWEVFFMSITDDGESSWDEGDGLGNEVKVFSFVVRAMREFMKKYEPQRIHFSAAKAPREGDEEGSRVTLYRRLVDRFAKDKYIAREFEIGLGRANKEIEFDLLRKPE